MKNMTIDYKLVVDIQNTVFSRLVSREIENL